MQTYVTKSGDTFATISRRLFGVETEAGNIARANPGAVEPLTSGVSLVVPPDPSTPVPPAPSSLGNADEVAVLVNGSRFRFWTSVAITRGLDTVDSISLSAPFSADEPELKRTFRPLSYADLDVTVGGAPLFSGTMVDVTPKLEATSKTVGVTGYSRPGVLADCTPPATMSLEFNGQGIQQVATALAAPFGVAVQMDAPGGAVFDRLSCKSSEAVLPFLAGMAQQRGLVISSTPTGKLLFRKSVESGTPDAVLEQGVPPLMSVTPTINARQYYSHVTGIGPQIVSSLPAAKHTEKNDRLAGVLRPHTFTLKDTAGADIPAAVRAKTGRMFGGAVRYSVQVNGWRNSSGEIWAPNMVLELTAPDAMVYKKTTLIVAGVTLTQTDTSKTASLSCVLPGAYSGKIPEVLPWDD